MYFSVTRQTISPTVQKTKKGFVVGKTRHAVVGFSQRNQLDIKIATDTLAVIFA